MARILLAEDDATLAKILEFKLEAKGYSVTVAHDGHAAWEYALCINFDLIITDYNMPKMKGADLCRHIRNDSRYDQTPIIMTSSFDRDLDMVKLIEELRLSAFFAKPFTLADLIKKVEEVLAECHA